MTGTGPLGVTDTSGHEIVELLDQTPASVGTSRLIAYQILKSANLNANLPNRVLGEYEAGFPDREKLSRLWEEVKEAQFNYDDMRENFAAHLSSEIFPGGLPLDGSLAGLLYEWADAIGVPEVDVTGIFIRSLSADGYDL